MPAGVSAYTPLANITLSSTASSVTFSSISQEYRDLVLVILAGGTSAGAGVAVKANGDTGVNFFTVEMRGTGSATGSFSSSNDRWDIGSFASLSGSLEWNSVLQVMDYSSTDKHKPALSRSNIASGAVEANAHRWASTSAITTLLVYPGAGSFISGSTFALYGVSA